MCVSSRESLNPFAQNDIIKWYIAFENNKVCKNIGISHEHEKKITINRHINRQTDNSKCQGPIA